MGNEENIDILNTALYDALVLRKKLAVAMTALRTIKADWQPGRRKIACDPFVTATVALNAIEVE